MPPVITFVRCDCRLLGAVAFCVCARLKINATFAAVRQSDFGRTGVSADEDAADVARVLAGDVSAFEAIVRRWQGPLVNLAYRFCRDRSRAEDMAQEAFLRALRSLRSLR